MAQAYIGIRKNSGMGMGVGYIPIPEPVPEPPEKVGYIPEPIPEYFFSLFFDSNTNKYYFFAD